MSSGSSDSVSAVLQGTRVAGGPDDSGGGGGEESWYDDEQSGLLPFDSPVSAADMLSRSLQQGYLRRRIEAKRRRTTQGVGERDEASSSSFARQQRQSSGRQTRKSTTAVAADATTATQSPSPIPMPAPTFANASTRRLFPDASRTLAEEAEGDNDERNNFISPPTARNNPDAAEERRRRRRSTARSSFAALDYDEDADAQSSRPSRHVPLASTPFHASTIGSKRVKGSSGDDEEQTPTQSRADAIASLFANSVARRTQEKQQQQQQQQQAQLQGRRSIISIRPNDRRDSFGSSNSGTEQRPKTNAFAKWGGGIEESPMDMLRRLAAAPGFAATATPSDQGRGGVEGEDDNRQRSALRPGSARIADRRRSILATPRDAAEQQRRGGGDEESVYSELGQARRRQGYGLSSPLRRDGIEQDESAALRSIISAAEGRSRLGGRPSSVRFADAASLEFVVEGNEDDENEEDGVEERELEDILAATGNATSREGFMLGVDDGDATGDGGFAYDIVGQPSGKDRRRANEAAGIFGGLIDDDDESVPESFQSAQQNAEAEVPDDENVDYDDYVEDVAGENYARFENDEQQASYDEVGDEFDGDNDDTVRERVFNDTAPTQRPLSDDDDDEFDKDIDIASNEVDDEVRRREEAARMQLLMKRSKRRQAGLKSTLTGETVTQMSSRLTHDLFRSMITPSQGIGSVTAPGQRRARPRITIDKLALEAVDTVVHHFFNQMAERLSARADARQRMTRRRKKGAKKAKDTIDESDVLALLGEDGTLNERMTLVSLARKYLPREMSDVLPPDLEKAAASALSDVRVKSRARRGKNKHTSGVKRRYLNDGGGDDNDDSSDSSSTNKRRKRQRQIVSLAEEPVTQTSMAERQAEARRLRAQARRFGVEKQTRNVWHIEGMPSKRAIATDADELSDIDSAETGESEEEMYTEEEDDGAEALTGHDITVSDDEESSDDYE